MPHLAPIKTSDGRFGYEAAGDLAVPSLVFLHGIGGAARAWRGQLSTFSDRYRAIAWDMPGYGASAPLPTVSIAALARALHDFLRALVGFCALRCIRWPANQRQRATGISAITL